MSHTSDDQPSPDDRTVFTRRSLLLGAIVSPVLAAACQSSLSVKDDQAQGPTSEPTSRYATPSPVPTPATEPISEQQATEHLLRRTTYGVTPAARAAVAAMGMTAWLDQQLDPESIDDSATIDRISQIKSIAMTPPELREAFGPGRGGIVDELTFARFLRAVHSERQLYEVMVGFWTDHFNINMADSHIAFLKPTDEREVIRPNALGRFADILVASAASPAMLTYLDNAESRADGDNAPNENYARELLELHTVGVDGGYTEDDVLQVAHIFSGWTVQRQTGEMIFRQGWHAMDPSIETLGWFPGFFDGQAAGESFLHHLALLPQTADFICTKLCRRFVADDPPATLVERAAAAYIQNDTQIAPVVRLILTSDEFRESFRQKIRRPFEYIAAVSRAINLDFETDDDGPVSYRIGFASRLLGEPVYTWPSPDGPPDVGPSWLNAGTMLQRWNVAMSLTTSSVEGITADISGPTLRANATASDFVEQFASDLGVDIDPVTTNACLQLLAKTAEDPAPEPKSNTLADLAAIALVSPSAHLR